MDSLLFNILGEPSNRINHCTSYMFGGLEPTQKQNVLCPDQPSADGVGLHTPGCSRVCPLVGRSRPDVNDSEPVNLDELA